MLTFLLVASLFFAQDSFFGLEANPLSTPLETPVITIDNGWYEATVKYFNPNTFTRSTYTLNVKVEYDRVTVIDFGNGGSVHTGFNNSGYSFNGGYLTFGKDDQGNIISASTNVSILEGSSSTSYEIFIG